MTPWPALRRTRKLLGSSPEAPARTVPPRQIAGSPHVDNVLPQVLEIPAPATGPSVLVPPKLCAIARKLKCAVIAFKDNRFSAQEAGGGFRGSSGLEQTAELVAGVDQEARSPFVIDLIALNRDGHEIAIDNGWL